MFIYLFIEHTLYYTMEMWVYMLFYFAIIMLKKHLSKKFFTY